MSAPPANKYCGTNEAILFFGAIVAGTACSICSKSMMSVPATGITGEEEVFSKPLFQTLGMFVGMVFGLVLHFVVVYWKIKFPGYEWEEENPQLPLAAGPRKKSNPTEKDPLVVAPLAAAKKQESVPFWMYFFLVIPALFDLGATALCMMGLRFLPVSVYQLLRGSGIVFVALMKQHVLRHPLHRFQWLGVAWNVVSVFLVSATALQSDSSGSAGTEGPVSWKEPLMGVAWVLAGAIVQSLQFVFEETVMTMEGVPSPPLLLIGMEGFWGTFFCVAVLYPLAYITPGSDHGSFENFENTVYMLRNSSTLQVWFFVYFVSILSYNVLAVLVTFQLNSIWHAILDNFRPITVWATGLVMFYGFNNTSGGEAWENPWSWLQVMGLVVLLYGTSIYNAPHPGGLQLKRQWYACWCLDYSTDYHEILQKEEEERIHAEWLERKANFVEKRRSTGSFAGDWFGENRM